MAEATNVNYSDEMVEKMVSAYTAAPTKATVEMLSNQFKKTTRSIIAKLSREGVYVPQARTTKSGEPIVRKEDIVSNIENALEIELPSLAKASKSDLSNLWEAVQGL
jgi:hypothetical protein